MNPRKDKVFYRIWLTKEEEEGLLEILGDECYFRRIGQLINKINKRGDLNKK